jgi:hypothetical protein
VRQNPEELIEDVQPGSWVFPLENGELLPESEILQKQAAAITKRTKKRTQ